MDREGGYQLGNEDDYEKDLKGRQKEDDGDGKRELSVKIVAVFL